MKKLEEAAVQYMHDEVRGMSIEDEFSASDIEYAFKAGAEWKQTNQWISAASDCENSLVDGNEYLVYGCIDSFTKCIAHTTYKDGWFIYKYDGRFVCNIEAIMPIPELPF